MIFLNNLRLSEHLKTKIRSIGSVRNLEFIISKSGKKTIKKDGILIHSAYDPAKEAENLVKQIPLERGSKYIFVLLGLGLGYHLEVLKRDFPNSIFIPVELDDDVLVAFLQEKDEFVITKYNKNDIYSILNFVDFALVKDVKFIQLPSLYRMYKHEYDDIGNEIARVVKAKFSDLLTRINFDKLWVKNVLLNIPNILRYGSLSEDTQGEFILEAKDKTFVIVGAGYSGLFMFDLIKKYRDRFILCAVDTVLKSLLSFGIIPDIVFSLDSQIANIKDFFGIQTKGLTLLADVVVSPELIRNFKGRVLITKTSHIEVIGGIKFEITNSVISWVEEVLGYRLLGLESGGSVVTNLFHLSLLLGANPVIMVGVDLGFPYLVSHVVGTPSNEYFTLKGNVFSTSDTLSTSYVLKDHISVKGVNDKECITHKIMETYKLWFDSASDTSSLDNVYNISDGVKLKGINNLSTMDGRKFFESFFSNKPSISIKTVEPKPLKVDTRRILESLSTLSEDLEFLVRDFSQNVFNEMLSQYPFLSNVVSKTLFPVYRGQKSFSDVVRDIKKDLSYLVNILKNLIYTLQE